MTNEAPPSGEVSQVVEHLFRHESGKMVATLARIFGVEHLTLAEDVVQEALARALASNLRSCKPVRGVGRKIRAGYCMRASATANHRVSWQAGTPPVSAARDRPRPTGADSFV